MNDPGDTYRAVFNDGETTATIGADVRLRGDGLEVRPEGRPSTIWPLNQLSRIDGPETAGLRLMRLDQPDARLTILNPVDAGLLQAALPTLRKARGSRRERRAAWRWVAGGIVAVALLGLAAVEGAPRAAALAPMEWTTSVGDNFRNGFLRFIGGDRCADPVVVGALARLESRLLAGVEPTAAFDPALVDVAFSDHHIRNAFAAPGGRVVIFAGLIDLLPEDAALGGDGLAGVIAHEIAHARLRHPTKALGRALGVQLIATLTGGSFVADQGLVIAQLAYGREAEREADALARQMLKTAGIGDAGLTRFFKIIEDRYGPGGGFLSSHPANPERAAAGEGVAGPDRAFTKEEWARFQTVKAKGCAAS